MTGSDFSFNPFLNDHPEFRDLLSEDEILDPRLGTALSHLKDAYFKLESYYTKEKKSVRIVDVTIKNFRDEIVLALEEEISFKFYNEVEEQITALSAGEKRNYFGKLKAKLCDGPIDDLLDKFLFDQFVFYKEIEMDIFFGTVMKSQLPEFNKYIKKQFKRYKDYYEDEPTSPDKHLKCETAGQKMMLLHALGILDYVIDKCELENNWRRLGRIFEPVMDESSETIRKIASAIYLDDPTDKNNPYYDEKKKNKTWLIQTLNSLRIPHNLDLK